MEVRNAFGLAGPLRLGRFRGGPSITRVCFSFELMGLVLED